MRGNPCNSNAIAMMWELEEGERGGGQGEVGEGV